MKHFDTWLLAPDLKHMSAIGQAADDFGFSGLWTSETSSDAFLPLVLAAEHSSRMNIGTSIAVAFPRSPTVLAHIGWDLARYSGGRFIMGLGSQVKAHNERRFGVKWEKPVAKMRETIEAMRAVWACWRDRTPLDYQGEFFNLNLMTPFFSGMKSDVPPPPVYISAVNKKMLELSGELCDGVQLHVFHTLKYLREVAWPQIQSGLDKAGRDRKDFSATSSVFAIPTDGRKPVAHYEAHVKQQLSFYMSTPAYRVVNDLHGWGEVGKALSQHARRGEWAEMPKLITDEMLDAFAVTGTWAALPRIVSERYGDLLDRISYYIPFVVGEEDDGWRASVAGFKALASE